MKKSIAIIGGGTAGLFFAAFIDTDLYDVTIYEKKKSLGRKFLVAGDGGFNLTHAEHIDILKTRYTPKGLLNDALVYFSNQDLRDWLYSISIPTFIGSSKRVFPVEGIKPIQVLKAIEKVLAEKKISILYNKEFTGWTESDQLILNESDIIHPDLIVFALGGASWKVTGSDGSWLSLFNNQGIKTTPFQASNCAFQVKWNADYIQSFIGKPLKNISISIGGLLQKGEVVITAFGLEGNAIYALSEAIQSELALNKKAVIHIDFKPTLTPETILNKIENSNYNTTETLKQILKLNKAQINLIKNHLNKYEYLDHSTLINTIKHFPITLTASASIDEAISTMGGIHVDAISQNYELNDLQGQYCIGEMLDWNATTGGYLIQGCVSMGAYLADQLNNK